MSLNKDVYERYLEETNCTLDHKSCCWRTQFCVKYVNWLENKVNELGKTK